MGKRKPRRKAPPKAAPPKLEMEFDCPFCCAIKSVQVFMKRKEGLASLSCRTCNVDYETQVSPLDEAVDVFSSWIDNCEEVNAPTNTAAGPMGKVASAVGGPLSLADGVLPMPPRSLPLRSPVAPTTKRRRTDNGRFERRRPSTDADLEAEEAAEAAQEAEETYSAHDDDEEEPLLDDEEEEESLGNVEDVNESQQRTSRGRLQKKAAWGSDDED